MANWGKCDFKELEQFRDNLKKLEEKDTQKFCEDCAKELAARILAKVIKRTPVGDYSDTYDLEDDGEEKFLVMSDKKGGTLRRGWTAGRSMAASQYANTLNIQHIGSDYVIEIINPVEYAPYVEYGHRQQPGRYVPVIGVKLKNGWVNGVFMMTISEKEVQRIAPALLQKRLNEKLKEVFK